MVAKHFKELVEMQDKYKVSLLYEASAGASIPIIRNLEEYYDNELLYSLRGILNGTTNYILTLMHNNGIDYNIALEEARAKGFAESDPTLDVGDGMPNTTLHYYRSCLWALPRSEEVFHYGIKTVSKFDMTYAREKGFKIKLVPFVGKLVKTQ